jgi:hypothetical protein
MRNAIRSSGGQGDYIDVMVAHDEHTPPPET